MNLPVGLVDPNNKSVGTANAIVQHNIGSLTADQFQIAVIVTGAYTFNNFNDDRIITVAKPLPGGLIAGGGEVANSDGAGGNDSNGYLQGETNGMYNTLFGLDVEFNKSLKNPQGKVWGKFFSYRKPDGTMDTVLHTYEFKSTAIAVLSLTTTNSATTTNNLASFSSKANLTDTTNPANPVGIEGGDQLQIDLLDGNVEGGAGDQIAITLYRKLSGVWYTIKWNGSKTVKKDIANGDIVVRPAY
jgi:hypothetical protein